MTKELDNYQKFLQSKKLKDKTIKAYIWHLEKFYEWLEEQKINPPTLQKYFDYLVKNYGNSNSINIKLIVLNDYLKFIHIKFSFELFSENNKSLKYLTKLELEKLLDSPLKKKSIINTRDKVLLDFLYFTGLKVNQISNLPLKQIDWNKNYLIIDNKQIKIPLTTIPYLKKYINLRKDSNNFLFINFNRAAKNISKPLSIRSIERILDKYGRSMKPPLKITPQILRNTLAKNMKLDNDIDTIKQSLGFQSDIGIKEYLKKI